MPAKKTTAKKSETTTPVKKAAAKKAAPAKKAPARPAAKKTPSKAPAGKKARPAFTPEERYRQIQEAAYYIAEKSGFTRDSAECWVEAEALITRLENA